MRDALGRVEDALGLDVLDAGGCSRAGRINPRESPSGYGSPPSTWRMAPVVKLEAAEAK